MANETRSSVFEPAANNRLIPIRPTSCRIGILPLHDARLNVMTFGIHFPRIDTNTPRIDRNTSRIYAPGNEVLVKVCMVQSSPRNQLLRAIGMSRAQVETQSNLTLARLGLSTPEITGYATVLNPFSLFDSALVVKRVDKARDALAYLNDDNVPESHRDEFVRRMIRGVTIMIDHRYALRDLRLCNVLASGDSVEPVWIDNDVKHAMTYRAALEKLTTTVNRVLKKDCPSIPSRYARILQDELSKLVK